MKTHYLKIRKEHYRDVEAGIKLVEIRKNDRSYRPGENIRFIERMDITGKIPWIMYPGKYLILHVLDFPEGLREGYVALSIKKL